MAVSEIWLVRTAGRMEQLSQFIAACCIDGYFQPEQASAHLSGSLGFVQLNEENNHAPLLHKIEALAAGSGVMLNRQKAARQGVADAQIHDYVEQLGEKLGRMQDERAALHEQLRTCEDAVEQYRHFTGLGIDLGEVFNSSFLKVRFGCIPKDSLPKLDAYAKNPYVLFIPCSQDAVNTWGAYFAPIGQADEVDRIFASLYFERLRIPGAVGTPEQVVAELEKNITILKDELAQVDARNQEFWRKEEKQCNRFYAQLSYWNAVFELRKNAAVHGDSFFYIGWIPKENIGAFEKAAGKISGISFETSAPDKARTQGHEPPIKLKNRRIFRPFEYIVSMFGMPSHEDVDVTAFVAVTYTLLFGMMFGDVGQGVVLALAGLFMWKKMRIGMGKILIYCGASAVLGGFCFGSVFGYEEMLDPLYRLLGMQGKPVHVMESISGLLTYSILIGITLVVLSMLLNAYSKWKHKEYAEVFFSQNALMGTVFYLSGVCLIWAFMTGHAPVPKSVYLPVFLSSAVLLFCKELLIRLFRQKKDWKPESWTDFLMESFFELFEYTLSFFSNTLSFLRLGAFVLVHAGMMMAVFTIAKGSNLAVIILGNVLVIVLEALFTSIQAMRLEYYEIFSRCYTGEGKEFEPIKLR